MQAIYALRLRHASRLLEGVAPLRRAHGVLLEFPDVPASWLADHPGDFHWQSAQEQYQAQAESFPGQSALGLSTARNSGIGQSSARAVIPLNADNRIRVTILRGA